VGDVVEEGAVTRQRWQFLDVSGYDTRGRSTMIGQGDRGGWFRTRCEMYPLCVHFLYLTEDAE
jgi:hypothetical protein